MQQTYLLYPFVHGLNIYQSRSQLRCFDGIVLYFGLAARVDSIENLTSQTWFLFSIPFGFKLCTEGGTVFASGPIKVKVSWIAGWLEKIVQSGCIFCIHMKISGELTKRGLDCIVLDCLGLGLYCLLCICLCRSVDHN